MNEVHRPIGNAVAKAWNMPPEMCKPSKTASNAVRFANALAKAKLSTQVTSTWSNDTILRIGRSMLGLDDDGIAALSTALRAVATPEASQ